MASAGAPPAISASTRARVALLFLLLAVLHTWPLASAPHRLSLNHNADAQLNAWIVGWVAHALPARPASLWRGDIFQPNELALTFSEPLIVPALAGAPIGWLGGSAVLTFNLLLVAGLALTAWTGWWIVTRWTGSPGAGLVAGALVAFNPHLLTRLPHLQAAQAWGLLLAWFFAVEALDRDDGRGRWRLAFTLGLVAATSLHWLFFAAFGIGLLVLSRFASGVRRPRWPALRRLATECAAGALVSLPVLVAYLSAGVVHRPLSQVADFSATLGGYATAMSRVHSGWSRAFFTTDVNVFFPGLVALSVAVVGLAAMMRVSTPARAHAPWWVALGIAGVVLSLGTATPVYGWLYALLPPLQGIRAAARFGYLYLVAVALFAGVGVAWMERRWNTSPAGRWLAAGILALVTLENLHAPIRTTPFTGVPAIYGLVADIADPVLLVELPFYPPDQVFENGEYVLNATGHWKPVMNGYSGATPLSYRRHADSFWFFPESWAIAAIKAGGATHAMVHLERFGADAEAVIRALDGRPDFRLMAADRLGHRLYRVVRE